MTWVTDLSHLIDETGSLPIGVPGPARRLMADDKIRWQCPSCGDNGIISNWQSTPWDRRQVQPVH